MNPTLAFLLVSAMLPCSLARLGSDSVLGPKSDSEHGRRLSKPGFFDRLTNEPKQDKNDHNRIIGGVNAAVGQFPWFSDWGGCGASLIHEDILLTAGHCAVIPTNDVYVGAYEALSTDYGAELHRVVQRRVHPAYDDSTLTNDIMLLKISSPTTITPVTLNDDSTIPAVGENLIAMGHGVTNVATEATSSILQKVTVPSVSHAQCASDYAFFNPVKEDVMLCAGFENGGKDSCQGDSGGPLVKQVGDSYIQVGVTSWGDGCAEPNAPGVYARVSGLKNWIDDQICIMSSNPPPSCPQPAPPAPTPEGQVSVRVDIVFDNFPNENGWSIIAQDGTVIVDHPQGSLSQPGLVTERVNVDPGEYTFTMTDFWADGICCAHGEGSYAIYAELESGDVLLAASDGVFLASSTSTFVVPDISDNSNNNTNQGIPAPTPEPSSAPVPTPEPSSAPVPTPEPTTEATAPPVQTSPPAQTSPPRGCEDSIVGTFYVNDDVGDKDCGWLAENQFYFDYLCSFVEVALECRATCDICDLLLP